MSVNAREEDYEHVELFDKPALFTNSRIIRDTVPDNLYCYDLRGSDYDPGRPITVEDKVGVNHAGTVLTAEPVTIPKEGFERLRGKLNFLGECLSLAEFCEEHKIEYKEPKYRLDVASQDEAALFFSQGAEMDAELGCIGHFRFYYDKSGQFVPSLWEDHQPEMKTQAFKDELDDLINTLRENGTRLRRQSRTSSSKPCAALSPCFRQRITGSYTAFTFPRTERLSAKWRLSLAYPRRR